MADWLSSGGSREYPLVPTMPVEVAQAWPGFSCETCGRTILPGYPFVSVRREQDPSAGPTEVTAVRCVYCDEGPTLSRL
jgi:hypothetical protein